MFGPTVSTESWLTFVDLQDQVTSRVVGAIAPKLEQAEIERAKRKPTESLATPTTISCVVWRRFINLPSRATKKR